MVPSKKILIHEAAVLEITKYIKKNEYKKGDRISSERDLSKLLNVSRTSIREALKILKAKEIITIRPGSGIYYNQDNELTPTELDDAHEYTEVLTKLKELAQARIMIETFCCIELIKTISEEELSALSMLEEHEHGLMRKEYETIDELFITMNIELMIREFYGNAYILEYHRNISRLWKRYFNEIGSVPYPLELRHHDHMEIISAIRMKNPSKIRKSVRMHVERTIEAVDKVLKK